MIPPPRTGVSPWNKGKKWPQMSGKNHPNWKGTTSLNQLIRHSMEYFQWRRDIFSRDDYTCQICGQRGVKLRANHIKKFADYPVLRFVLNNGIVICEKCDYSLVMRHEEEWESYFNFNLMTRGILKEEPCFQH